MDYCSRPLDQCDDKTLLSNLDYTETDPEEDGPATGFGNGIKGFDHESEKHRLLLQDSASGLPASRLHRIRCL